MTRKDSETIGKIIARTIKLTAGKYDAFTVSMDLNCCHDANSLNLEKLLNFDDSNFLHDVCGINRHLDHKTGELKDCFWPRCGGRK